MTAEGPFDGGDEGSEDHRNDAASLPGATQRAMGAPKGLRPGLDPPDPAGGESARPSKAQSPMPQPSRHPRCDGGTAMRAAKQAGQDIPREPMSAVPLQQEPVLDSHTVLVGVGNRARDPGGRGQEKARSAGGRRVPTPEASCGEMTFANAPDPFARALPRCARTSRPRPPRARGCLIDGLIEPPGPRCVSTRGRHQFPSADREVGPARTGPQHDLIRGAIASRSVEIVR